MRIIPVIHHLDELTSINEASAMRAAGADGIFLISMHGENTSVIETAKQIKEMLPDLPVGINLLGSHYLRAMQAINSYGLNMLWYDSPLTERGLLTLRGEVLAEHKYANPQVEIFSTVSFKYQPADLSPAESVRAALQSGFTPTTSGDATGVAPLFEKIALLAQGCDNRLAIASGVTAENIDSFSLFAECILVNTGIARDYFHHSPEALATLLGKRDLINARAVNKSAPK